MPSDQCTSGVLAMLVPSARRDRQVAVVDADVQRLAVPPFARQRYDLPARVGAAVLVVRDDHEELLLALRLDGDLALAAAGGVLRRERHRGRLAPQGVAEGIVEPLL